MTSPTGQTKTQNEEMRRRLMLLADQYEHMESQMTSKVASLDAQVTQPELPSFRHPHNMSCHGHGGVYD